MERMMERMRGQGGVYGGVMSLCLGRQIEQQKNTNVKYDMALDDRHLIFTHSNQPKACRCDRGGMGWDTQLGRDVRGAQFHHFGLVKRTRM
jgi:hypothetical protein